MKPTQFHALAQLADMRDTTRIYAASRDVMTHGAVPAHAARAQGITPGTLNNALRRIERVQRGLPTLQKLVTAAMGEDA